MKNNEMKPVTAFIILSFVFLFVLGWVLNVAELTSIMNGAIDAEFVLRIVGVFVAPLGAILGYF